MSKHRKIKLPGRRSSGVEPTAISGHSKRTFVMRRFAREVTRVAGKYTKRQRWENQLQESEEFSSSLLSNSPFPIIVINPDTSVRYVNPALEKLTGFTSAELMGRKAPYPWWTDETLNKTEKDFAKAMCEGAQKLEELFQTKDGEIFWVEITSAPIKSDDKLKYYLANWVDITERKQAEEELREAEEKFRTIVETAPSLLVISDAKGNNIYVSPNGEEITGYTQEELLGKVRWWVHEDDTARARETFERAIREGVGTTNFEYKAVKKNGQVWYASSSWEPLKEEDGKLKGIVLQTIDVTERKRAEEALRQSEEKFRTMLSSSPDAITLTDLDSRIVECNQAALHTHGFSSKEEAIGQQSLDYIAPQDRPTAIENMKKTLEQGTVRDVEYTFLTKDGREFPGELSASLICDSDGEPAFFIGITRNITERKRAEEELRESKDKYRKLFELGSDALFLIEVDTGRILDLNDTALKMYGYSREEALQMKNTDFSAEPAQTRQATVEHEQQIPVRYHKKKDGTIFPTDISVASFTWYGRKICIAAIRDVTERKRAEEETNQIFEIAADGMRLVDKDFNVLRANQTFAILAHLPKDQTVGKKCYETLHGPLCHTPRCPLTRVLGGEKHVMDETEKERKDGTRIPCIVTATPFVEPGGKLIGIIEDFKDITERKKAEEALRKTTEDLKAEREELAEMNLVFKHIFEHLEEERQEYKQHICQDVEQVVMPILERLKEKVGSTHGRELEALEINLKDVLAKDVDVFRERYAKLTPRELEICEMIKVGLSSKEISENLNLSLLTVHKHREEIRRKLGITNKAVNLGSYLLTR